MQPNPLHEKTNTLLYLLRLLQDFFNKSFGVIIGSDMINTVPYLRCVTVSPFNE